MEGRRNGLIYCISAPSLAYPKIQEKGHYNPLCKSRSWKRYNADEHKHDPSIYHIERRYCLFCFPRRNTVIDATRNEWVCDWYNKQTHYTKGSPVSPYFWRITIPMEFVEGMRGLHLTHSIRCYIPTSEVENVLRNSFSFFFPSILSFVSIMAK